MEEKVNRGEFDSALIDCDAALHRYEGRSDKWEWRFRILKARILVSRSQGSEALSILNREPPAGLAATEIPAERKLYQGIAHRYTQEFADAERDFEETAALAKPVLPRYICQLLIARADLWVDEKKYDSAETDYRAALILAHRNSLGRLEANSLADLARLATARGHYDEAIDRYANALHAANELGMKGNTSVILGNMGWSYFELGDFDNALEFFRKGADASEKSGLVGNTAYWFSGVANSYMALQDYPAAEALAKSTLERARQLNNAQTITGCLNTLTELMLKAGRAGEAEAYVKEALDWEEKGKDQFGTLESTLLSARIAGEKRQFHKSQGLFERLTTDSKIPTALKWQASAGLAKLHDDEGLFQQAEREFNNAVKTVETAQDSIDSDELRVSFLAGAIEFYDDYIDFLVRRKRMEGALNVAEESRARTLARGLASKAVDDSGSSGRLRPQEIARRLNATLLFYWVGHNRSYLWVIGPAKTTLFKLPKASEIEAPVKSYRKTLPDVDDALDPAASDGKKLYAMLVEPAQRLIPAGRRVILLPAESLYGLNFETLIVPDPKPHFWIEDVILTTASSLTLLDASLRRLATKGQDLLLVGNVVPTFGFPALSQAPTEMQKVEHYFPAPHRKVLEGKQATATAYLSSNPEKYTYLHFVTHGTASRTRPLESAVVLSPEGDSYKLYARDVVSHHLNAQLVTISACETSGKRTISGEGLVGLSWAFLRAGAHNVIGALWDVSDVSTPWLMDSLYGELSQGRDPASALRDAKLKMLHSADPDSVFKKPFYWAPFQLYAGS